VDGCLNSFAQPRKLRSQQSSPNETVENQLCVLATETRAALFAPPDYARPHKAVSRYFFSPDDNRSPSCDFSLRIRARSVQSTASLPDTGCFWPSPWVALTNRRQFSMPA